MDGAISALEQLARVLAPPASARGEGKRCDWAAVEQALRVPLPDDYKAFIALYGTGSIDAFLWVLSPNSENPNLELLRQTEQQLAGLREFRSTLRQHDGPMARRLRIFPEPGGFLPWGITDNGDVCYWRTGEPNPNAWPTVVADGRHSDWVDFKGTMTELLVAPLTRECRLSIFPDEFPSKRASSSSRILVDAYAKVLVAPRLP